jgi:hypothetical protein
VTALSGPVRTFVGVRALKKEISKEEGKGEMKMRKSRTRKEGRRGGKGQGGRHKKVE